MSLFAVIPAAGLSRRMGRPKLTLDLGGRPVIARLLEALREAGIDRIVLVARADDEALRTAVAGFDLALVLPETAPPDMRTSVEHALAAIRSRQDPPPQPDDGWLLIPADHPVLDASVLRELIAAWQNTDADVLIPVCRGRRGHPTFFRWRLAEQVASLPAGQGLNRLTRAAGIRVCEHPVASDSVLIDLDTPGDYERLRREPG